jgi:hypothetical protein
MPPERKRDVDDLCTRRWPAGGGHFDGGAITSKAGALLFGATDQTIALIERFAACCKCRRADQRVAHDLSTLVGRRVPGIAPSRASSPCLLRE